MGLFGRIFGRGKEKLEDHQPEQARQAPAPAAEPKRGFLGKVADRLRGKDKKEDTPPAPPPDPGTPTAPPPDPGTPTAPSTTPPTGEGDGGDGEEDGDRRDGGSEEGSDGGEKDYSNAPSSLSVQIPGTWKTSKRSWRGTVEGSVQGSQVVDFLKAIDEGREEEAVQMICDDFGDGSFGAAVEVSGSSWSRIIY